MSKNKKTAKVACEDVQDQPVETVVASECSEDCQTGAAAEEVESQSEAEKVEVAKTCGSSEPALAAEQGEESASNTDERQADKTEDDPARPADAA